MVLEKHVCVITIIEVERNKTEIINNQVFERHCTIYIQ